MTREELLRFGGSCNKNELRRKRLCFICKEPWEIDQSCLSDTEEIEEKEKMVIPSDHPGEDSSSDESMGLYDDASKGHELCRIVDGRPNFYDEQSVDPMGDIQDSVSPVMSQHEKHMMEHELAEGDDVYNIHDDPFGEIQLGVHIEPVMEEDLQPPLGLAIDEVQTYVQIVGRVTVFTDTCPQDILGIDRVVLPEDSRRQVLLEMVVHPSLGRPIDEVWEDS